MSESPAATNFTSETNAPKHLSFRSFVIIMSLLLAIFAFLNPIWETMDMPAWDENILWSYAPIPLLAALFLAFEKKLGWAALFLESLKLTFVKFAITFLFANVLWSFLGAPGTGLPENVATPTESSETAFSPRAVPEPTTLDPGDLGSIAGRVEDANGNPVANAFVRITSGLEAFVFTPPSEKLTLTNDGSGFSPSFAVAQTYQLVAMESSTDGIHTIVILDDAQHRMLNFPVLPESERLLMFERAHGLTNLACSVHREEETGSSLLIVSNPFFARTDQQGNFRFTDVPARSINVAVLSEQLTEIECTVDVVAKIETQVLLATK
ncbi:MAG: hypothetical protein ACI8TQ_001881 [Planctomycetota bacterium]|jgi:hypothetical protein